MQFVVTALDFTDADAINRRMEFREKHLAVVNNMIANGSFLSGGAILDDKGKMIGSSLHLEFANQEALENHLQSDPYFAGTVWEKIEIKQIKLVAMK